MSRRDKFFIPSADKRLGNRYELLECLGDGSHGWVWRAERLADGEIVAVKIPKAQGDPTEYLEEGKALIGKPSHPNVINLYWMGRVPPEREWYAIEMEYFPSRTLAQLLDQGEQGFVASYSKILGIYRQVLEGVEHLHGLGMCHGDIKPQNILISGDQVKLTDFGSSMMPEEMYARTRENGGTILYSAPEFAGVTRRERQAAEYFLGDVYSLGVLLYHLVTARLPHDTLSQVIRHSPFPRPREINTSVCPAMEDFILRCLPADPTSRWQSAGEMLSVFRRVSQAQLDYSATRVITPAREPLADWSSIAVRHLEEGKYDLAENAALAQFDESRDPHAFLLVITAAHRDGRHFDCLRMIEEAPEMLSVDSPVARDTRRIALAASLATRQIGHAEQLIEESLREEEATPELLLKKATILGLQARYAEACQILLDLNRSHPGRPAIQKRLALVYEQMRDIGKASAFLKAYVKQAPDDTWAQQKLSQFAALGG
jgi:serine/threonine-protein kinase